MPETYDIADVRMRTTRYAPYLYKYVASLIPVERPGLGTFCVDQFGRLYYDRALFAQYSLDQAVIILLHETLHPLLRHFERGKAFLGENPSPKQLEWWNVATDMVINQILRDTRREIKNATGQVVEVWRPEMLTDWIQPEDFDFPLNQEAEEYYRRLQKREEQQQQEEQQQSGSTGENTEENQEDQTADQASPNADSETTSDDSEGENDEDQGQDQGGQAGGDGEPYEGEQQPQPGQGSGGSGADGQPREWECAPPEASDVEGHDGYERDRITQSTIHAIDERAQSQGDVPGYLGREVDKALRPQVDPHRKLQAAVRNCCSFSRGVGDYTFQRMPRRHLPGGIRCPAHQKAEPRIVLIIDTSGSMDSQELQKALGIVEHELRKIPEGRVHVIAGDTAKAWAATISAASKVELKGGGGTRMDVIMEEASAMRPRPDAILVVTDGWTPWPKQRLPQKVVVCLTEEAGVCNTPPEWCETIVLGKGGEM